MRDLLELRRMLKKRKPGFLRQDAHKKRLRARWVKPRGLHSKVRLRKRGHPGKVSSGYGFPKEVRGLSKEGLKIIRIYNENELGKVNKEKEGIIIAGGVGLKNKVLLLKKAKEKGINVLNLDVEDYLKKKGEEINRRLEKKKAKEEKKKKKKEEKEEKKEEKLEEKLSDEEKKEQEKLEKDKLLTKRET